LGEGVSVSSFLKDAAASGYVSRAVRLQAYRAALKCLRLSSLAPASAAATATVGAANANSTIDGSAFFSPRVLRTDSRLSYAGTELATTLTDFYQGANISLGGASKTANLFRLRFQTDAPQFDITARGNNANFLINVDGVPLSRALPVALPNDGNSYFTNVTFGADTQGLEVAGFAGATKVAGGSGYALNDVLTVSGGTSTTAAQIRVTGVSAGAVTSVQVVNKGVYTVAPSNPVSVTGGTGTGATFNLIWGQTHTTRKWRKIELWGSASFNFRGLNVAAYDQVKAWPVGGPRFMWMGDSYTGGTNIDYPGGQFAAVASQLLGVEDYWLSGISGSGYINQAGFTNFNDRVADVTAYAPTDRTVPYVVVTCGGINDSGSSSAAITAAVTSYYSTLMAALPNAYFACVGPWRGPTNNPANSVEAAVQAGFEAAQALYDPTGARSVYLDTYAESWQTNGGYATALTGTGNSDFWISSDGVHPGQAGYNELGALVAGRLAQWFASL
jgi:lysophospholipase L1-like esterase